MRVHPNQYLEISYSWWFAWEIKNGKLDFNSSNQTTWFWSINQCFFLKTYGQCSSSFSTSCWHISFLNHTTKFKFSQKQYLNCTVVFEQILNINFTRENWKQFCYYLSFGAISLITICTGHTPIPELLKIGMPSEFSNSEMLFELWRIPPDLQCFLYSSPSIISRRLEDFPLSRYLCCILLQMCWPIKNNWDELSFLKNQFMDGKGP